MHRLLVAGSLIITLLAGLIRLLVRHRELSENKQFAGDFLERLAQYVQSDGADHESYVWLVHRSPKMQSRLGVLGVARSYRPPFENYVICNYPIIVNALPELCRSLESSLSIRQARRYAAMIQETLIRYLGVMDDQLERAKRDSRNPVIWLREGVRLVLIIPISLLSWIGLISAATVGRISDSTLFKMLSGLVALVGFVGAVVGIATDWQSFVAIVKGVIGLK